MSNFKKGDLVEMLPCQGSTYTVWNLDDGDVDSFVVRSGHLGVVVESGIYPLETSRLNEYLEIYFQKRQRSGIIHSKEVKKV